MPLGSVLPIALRIFLAVAGSQSESGDHGAAGCGTNFGVFAYVAQKGNFIHASCHVIGSCKEKG
jgi:hypothetical protein